MVFGDSKNMIHLQQTRIQAQKTHKENHKNYVTNNLHKNLLNFWKNISLCVGFSTVKSDLKPHN
jgi:uncharacterized protein YbcI